MSLNGLVTGTDVSIEHRKGVGSEQMHQWLFDPTSTQGRPRSRPRCFPRTIRAIDVDQGIFLARFTFPLLWDRRNANQFTSTPKFARSC